MLDPKFIRQNAKALAERLKIRGYELDIDVLQNLEEERKQLQTKTQELKSARNQLAKSIGQAKSAGADVTALMEKSQQVNEQLRVLEERFDSLQQSLQTLLLSIPNIPAADVPAGRDESCNQELRRIGEPKNFSFTPKDHVELGAQLGDMDFVAAHKVACARFVVLTGQLAQLQRALTQFMLDVHIQQHGYQEVYVPYLVNEASLYGTGQLPKFDNGFQVIAEPSLYLIPTAEVPMTNLVRDEIIPFEKLPLKFVSHTPCFRSEAGSYGKDTRGMIRQHQFEKVELVQIVTPEQSEAAHEALTQDAEKILQLLGLPYRVMLLCAGDMGFSAQKTYDLEVWLPGQKAYREISSCSCFGDFQARRMQARFRNPKTHKTEWVCTLNGSALAVGRTLVAILENYQDENGHIHLPTVLHAYMGGKKILAPSL